MDDHLDGRLNIRLPQALLDRAHERSKRTGISISWLVRRVLALWVSGWQPPATTTSSQTTRRTRERTDDRNHTG